MSVLPAEVNAQLVQLLQQLQSADNTVRSQAEDVLQNQWTSQRPEWLLMGLVEQAATSTNTSVCHPTSPGPRGCCDADPPPPSCAHSRPSSSAG
jgi:hypothetical protein